MLTTSDNGSAALRRRRALGLALCAVGTIGLLTRQPQSHALYGLPLSFSPLSGTSPAPPPLLSLPPSAFSPPLSPSPPPSPLPRPPVTAGESSWPIPRATAALPSLSPSPPGRLSPDAGGALSELRFSPNLSAAVLPLVSGAVAAASNTSAADVGDRLLAAASSLARRNWSEAEQREQLERLASQANESYQDLVSQTVTQVSNLAWWLGGWVDTAPERRNLRARLESLIALQSKLRGVAISLSWMSAHESFTLVAGEVDGRKVSPDDVFLFGSGTKPYTAAAVMRAVERKRLNLSALAAPLADEGLRRLGSRQTLGKLFGSRAANITVAHLLHMSSGIADFDYPEFDNALLREGTRTIRRPAGPRRSDGPRPPHLDHVLLPKLAVVHALLAHRQRQRYALACRIRPWCRGGQAAIRMRSGEMRQLLLHQLRAARPGATCLAADRRVDANTGHRAYARAWRVARVVGHDRAAQHPAQRS